MGEVVDDIFTGHLALSHINSISTNEYFTKINDEGSHTRNKDKCNSRHCGDVFISNFSKYKVRNLFCLLFTTHVHIRCWRRHLIKTIYYDPKVLVFSISNLNEKLNN